MRVEIWSDIMCPWCYVGERRLAEAVERYGNDVEVIFRAFELDKDAPRSGVPLSDYLARKFGGPAAVSSAHVRLDQVGAEAGIEFRWDGKLRFNTFDAHRLIAWALATEGPPTQARLVERLFYAYFTDNAHVSDHRVLADLATEAGLDRDLVLDVLATDAFTDEVRADQHRASELNISAVPSFVVEGTWLVPGAQDVDTFVRVLERAAERLTDTGG